LYGGIKPQLDIVDRQVLEQSIEVTMSLPISRLKEWVKQTDLFVRKAVRRNKHRTKLKNNSITQYFSRRQSDRQFPDPIEEEMEELRTTTPTSTDNDLCPP
jgi:hypothetical protein